MEVVQMLVEWHMACSQLGVEACLAFSQAANVMDQFSYLILSNQ